MNGVQISQEQLAEFVRSEVAKILDEERPFIRAQVMEEMKWVTEATGVQILEITGKQPLRTFRRLVSSLGVKFVKRGAFVRWKRCGEHSLETALEKHSVRASSKRRSKIVSMQGNHAA